MSNYIITLVIAAITPAGVRIVCLLLPLLFLPPDPEHPFLRRDSSGEGNSNKLDTILITRTSTHVLVPCLVTVPDLNVTLHAVCVANLVSLYLPLFE